MKIKTDFITNSSSTSFVAWGIKFYIDDVIENEKFLKFLYNNFESKKNIYYTTFEEFLSADKKYFKDIIYDIWNKIPGTCLSVSTGRDGDYFMIGGEVEYLNEQETLNQYKNNIIIDLNKMGFETKISDIIYICESWYDG